MKTIVAECPYYSEKLLDRFKSFRGRIGVKCDECTKKEGEYNGIHLVTEILRKGGKRTRVKACNIISSTKGKDIDKYMFVLHNVLQEVENAIKHTFG
jgi:hypothetical protein